MKAISVEISRWIDDHQPGWVECRLIDAEGRLHLFTEKAPVVTAESIGPQSSYPLSGAVACEVQAEWVDANGRSLLRVGTTHPDGVESTTGESTFIVLSTQVVDI
ncbi:hypothetical protein ACSFA7_28725 [Variovorax sp. LT1R20]|uniref:hypothetical protein n=1 Tax=Variovorax sp. LT1R20 TaxID=3443729 RepID=UPI003F4489AF